MNDKSTKRNFREWACKAWRMTITSGAFVGILFMVINIIILANLYAKYPVRDGQITIFEGSKVTTEYITTAIHLIINIMSTILLASSNFSMQCLNSPTRREIENAHQIGSWVHVGTPSLRNLFHVSRAKKLLWSILVLSSFPLHMIWNSVIFNDSEANPPPVTFSVFGNFSQGAPWSYTLFDSSETLRAPILVFETITELQEQAQRGELTRLSLDDCYRDYVMGTQVLNVIFIVDPSDYDPMKSPVSGNRAFFDDCPSVVAIWYNMSLNRISNLSNTNPIQYTCDGEIECGQSANQWAPTNPDLGDQGNAPVRACLQQPPLDKRHINVVPYFLLAVILCIGIKVSCYILTLYITQRDPPLCTIGDVIQSFIEEPDIHIRQSCLATKRFNTALYPYRYQDSSQFWTFEHSTTWKGGRHRWIAAADLRQWAILLILWTTAMALLLWQILAFYEPSWGLKDVYYLFVKTSTTSSILLANIPQIVISYIYLGLNNTISSFLAMKEWCGYSIESEEPFKGLRVTNPVPNTAQRSSYFLSAPYRWSIPIMAVMAIAHWLVSEIVSPHQFQWVDGPISKFSEKSGKIIASEDSLECYLLMMVITLVVNVLLCLILVGLSLLVKFPGGIPLAGCCSASMAAACQPGPKGAFPPDLAHQKLKWGVVQSPVESKCGIGHATFSTTVMPLEPGMTYA